MMSLPTEQEFFGLTSTEMSRLRRWAQLYLADFPTLPLAIGLCYVAAMKGKAVVVVDPEIMNGTPCFAGTRVPVRALLDYIEGGESLDEFLEQFPTVSRKQAVAFLEQASERLLATA